MICRKIVEQRELIGPTKIKTGKFSTAGYLFDFDRAEVWNRLVVMNGADVIAPAIGETRMALGPEQEMMRYAIEKRFNHGLHG